MVRYIENDYLQGHPSPAGGFIDDVLLVADSFDEMKTLTHKTTDFLDYTGMEAKPSKCARTSAKEKNWQ